MPLLCRSDQPSDWLRVLEVVPLCALKRIALSHSNQHFYLVFWPSGSDAGAPSAEQADTSSSVAAALEDFSELTILNVINYLILSIRNLLEVSFTTYKIINFIYITKYKFIIFI